MKDHAYENESLSFQIIMIV